MTIRITPEYDYSYIKEFDTVEEAIQFIEEETTGEEQIEIE